MFFLTKLLKLVLFRSGILIHGQIIFNSILLSKPYGVFLNPEAEKTSIMTMKVKKFKENCKFCQNYAEIRDVKVLKNNSLHLETIQ